MTIAESLVKLVSNALFEQWADIRDQLEALEAKRREIEPLVIDQSLTVLQQHGKDNCNSHIVWEDKHKGKRIVIQSKQDTSVLKNNPILQEIDELIALESEKACEHNKAAIEQTEKELALVMSQVKTLEAKLAGLKQTDAGLEMLVDRAQIVAELSLVKKSVLAYQDIPAPKK